MEDPNLFSDEYFMRAAYQEALKAAKEGEIPVGAVVVSNNKIIGKGYNQTEKLCDVTAHAEMIALTAAANHLGSKYLIDCDLYVTLEPCVMCAGALRWAQFRKVIFATEDLKQGFLRIGNHLLHPKTVLSSGPLHHECKLILEEFFKKLRD